MDHSGCGADGEDLLYLRWKRLQEEYFLDGEDQEFSLGHNKIEMFIRPGSRTFGYMDLE